MDDLIKLLKSLGIMLLKVILCLGYTIIVCGLIYFIAYSLFQNIVTSFACAGVIGGMISIITLGIVVEKLC